MQTHKCELRQKQPDIIDENYDEYEYIIIKNIQDKQKKD